MGRKNKIISVSRESAFIWGNISPHDGDLGQPEARSWLGGETFSSYELNFLLVEIRIMAKSRLNHCVAQAEHFISHEQPLSGLIFSPDS